MTKPSPYLTVIGVVILLGLFWYLIFGRGIGGPPAEIISPLVERGAVPEIDFSVLESKAFDEFKAWSVLPLQPVPTGKANPFSR